jgi:CheY-like chemotaxis protein
VDRFHGSLLGRHVLTALVVDDSTAARHRVATLLQLAGWRVHGTGDPASAVRAAARIAPDLVVAERTMRAGSGLALLQQLRRSGSRARLLLVTARPDRQVPARTGGIPCLAKPVDPRELIAFLHVAFLRGRSPGPAPEESRPRMRVPAERLRTPTPAAASPGAADAAWQDRQRDFFLSSLPHRLSLITDSARAGDAETVAVAAQSLAGESGRSGSPEVAGVCRTIAEDARRGVLSQVRLMQLVMLASVAGSAQRPA